MNQYALKKYWKWHSSRPIEKRLVKINIKYKKTRWLVVVKTRVVTHHHFTGFSWLFFTYMLMSYAPYYEHASLAVAPSNLYIYIYICNVCVNVSSQLPIFFFYSIEVVQFKQTNKYSLYILCVVSLHVYFKAITLG